MRFIGQPHIIRRLNLVLPYLLETGEGASLLFRGPSGYGKTRLCRLVANYFVGDMYYEGLGDDFIIRDDIRVHFIDEIHLCKSLEILYPIIDSKKHILLFATNFDSSLPEAFLNRNQNFIFSSYSTKELIKIFKSNFRHNIPTGVIKHIIELANRNPRIIIEEYVKTLKLLYRQYQQQFLNLSAEQIISQIDEIHGIKNGLVPSAIDYLSFLKSVGGRAPIDTIVNGIKLDKNTIKYDIEPPLISKGLIKISQKGRELC